MCDNDDHRWESVSDYGGTKLDMFVSYCDSEFDEHERVGGGGGSDDDEDYDDFDEDYFDMAGSLVEVLGTTPRMGRRSMALSDIDPKYVSQSGIWEASEVETSRGSIRIQHLTAVASAGPRPLSCGNPIGGPMPGPSRLGSRFPKLEECAHFHYDILELPLLKIRLRDEPNKYNTGTSALTASPPPGAAATDEIYPGTFSIEVLSGSQCWIIRRTYANFKKLDEQLHRCVWDRSFSQLQKVTDKLQVGASTSAAAAERDQREKSPTSEDEQVALQRKLIDQYLNRLSQLPTNQITCGTVLSWLEIDNRGRHIVSSDDNAINTPAVAAACAIRQYVAKASDELSFEIGDMISVIDMPPPEESSWWRGKRRFTVGFFPRDCVQVIGEKIPSGLPNVPSSRKQQRLSAVSSLSSSSNSPNPDKPILQKHGKLIAFFRTFILNRPSRRTLKQTGILRERVFGCDLAEHLLNTGTEVPDVLKCCAEFIELEGIVDGIYRMSGVTSNIQKLRNAFDEGTTPNLAEDEAIKLDIHSVSSCLKMYFRELPNPLCTYQLYDKFREAIEAGDKDRLGRIREVAQELPPPHYRTLEYLLKHLARVAEHSDETGMTARNMAIVWAPNLIRCKDLEAGGVTALKGIGVQAIVTEYLVRYADLIFNDKLPEQLPSSSAGFKSLPASPPIKYMSLDGERDFTDDDRKFIEVGGGPASLPSKYHTVIDMPGRRSNLKSKRSAPGWKTFFSRNRSFSKPRRKQDIVVGPPTNFQHHESHYPGRLPLRPVKSVESLVSSPLYRPTASATNGNALKDAVLEIDETIAEVEQAHTFSNNTESIEEHNPHNNEKNDSTTDVSDDKNSKTHNRSISHDSYFEFGEFLKKRTPYIDETLEEEDDSESRASEDAMTSNDALSNATSPAKGICSELSSGAMGDTESASSRLKPRSSCNNSSTTLPSVSASSLAQPMIESFTSTSMVSSSSDDFPHHVTDEATLAKSPLLKPKPRYSILRNERSQGQSSDTDSVRGKLLETDTGSSHYSESEASTSDIHRSYEHALNTCHIMKDFSLPLDREKTEQPSCDTNIYDIDRNSSIDNSSTDTTPGTEAFNKTSVLYSPLLNASSPGYDKCNFKGNANVPLSSTGMFVCPLFEGSPKSQQGTTQPGNTVVGSMQQQRTGLEPKKSFKTQIRQYENIEILVPSTEDDCFVTNEETPDILWDQGRFYQNLGQHVTSEPLDSTYLQQEVQVIHVDGNSVTPQAVDVPTEDLDQHYENVNGRNITSPEFEEGLYECNIYEDIEDDDDAAASAHNSKQDRPPSLPNRNNPSPGPRDGESRMSNSSDLEAYESVQFGANVIRQEQQDNEVDCYAEVGLMKPRLNSNPHSAEQSSCQTEDVVTYLDLDMSKNNNTRTVTDSLNERADTRNDSTSNALTPSTDGDEEVRHIDSPLIVGNPLYGVELREKINQHISTDKALIQSNETKEKTVGRSNSVPLTDNLNNIVQPDEQYSPEHSLPSSIPEHNINEARHNLSDSKDVNIIDTEMLLLWKRLSEPSLTQAKKDEKVAALDAWRLADAKRLANRKQSVRELLSKFEQKDSLSPSPSPTNNVNWKNSRNSPGLPRPDKQNSNLRHQSTPKFQHHRFSIGDILMSQSLTSADSPNQSGSYSLMSRSDTYPELRTDSTKENDVTSDASQVGGSPSALVPEKTQAGIRVAMSSVDMNDPSTRERIEKYKEERRLFLRQRMSTEHADPKLGSNSISHDLLRSSSTAPGNLFDRSNSSCSSDNDVFTSANVRIINIEDVKSVSVESPRKRAFSEDVAQPNTHSNQHKAIKTEPSKMLPSDHAKALKDGSTAPSTSVLSAENVGLVTEEINVREKVALWSTSAVSSVLDRKPSYTSPYGADGLNRAYKSKSALEPSTSLPHESALVQRKLSVPTPVVGLRRELTTGSIDMNRAKLASRVPGKLNAGDSHKKIKDMAAFFEGKHF